MNNKKSEKTFSIDTLRSFLFKQNLLSGDSYVVVETKIDGGLRFCTTTELNVPEEYFRIANLQLITDIAQAESTPKVRKFL